MSHLKYLFFLLLFLLSSRINSQDPNWNSLLIIPSSPSPYISDWENNPNNISYSIQYLGQGSATIILEFSIYSDNLGELLNGSSNEIDFTGPQQQDITGTDLVNWNETTWNKSVEVQVIRTGLFPEGHYTACIEAYDLNENLLTESCQEFTIAYPDPPYLIAPLSADSIDTPYPTFQWSPVINTFSSDPIIYDIRIVELLKGQTLEQAITANYPHFEEKINITTLSYPPSAQLLEKNKTYVWQVQALNEDDLPAATNNGQSEIWSFKYKVTSPLEGITFVNDGISGDEDFTYGTKKLAANWSEIPNAKKYFYAIGTTVGGTDVVNWTDNGLFSNFSKTDLNLTIGSMYFVSVKAERNDGSFTNIKTSDGVTVKSTSGLDLLVDVDPVILNYYHDDVFSSQSSNIHPETSQISFTFDGPTGLALDINKIKLIWRDENNNLIKDEGFTSLDKYTFHPSVIIKPKNIGTTLSFSPIHSANSFFENDVKIWDNNFVIQSNKYFSDLNFDMNNGLLTLSEVQTKTKKWFDDHQKKYKLSLVFQGNYQDKNNVGRSLESDPIELTILYHPGAKLASLFDITSTTNTLSFSPKKSQDILDLDITLLSSSEDAFISLDTRTDEWFKDGVLFKTTVQKLASPIVMQTGTGNGLLTTETHKSVTYTIDSTDFKQFLNNSGNGQAYYTLSVQYSGTDKNGSLIQGKLDKPVPVTFTVLGTLLTIEESPADLFYALNKFSDQITLTPTLYANPGSSVELDELVTHWYKMDNLLYKTVVTPLNNTIKVNANQTVTFNTDLTFEKQFIQDALQNQNKAAYSLKIELRGKDNNGQPIAGMTNSSITANLATTTVDLTVQITPTEQIFDEDHITNNWNVKLNYKGKEQLIIDKLYAVWYDFAGKFVSRKPAETKTIQFKPPSGSEQVIVAQTITDYERITFMRRPDNYTIGKSNPPYAKESFKMHFEYEGVDNLGRKVVGKSNELDVGLMEKIYPLKVIASPDEIATSDSSVKIKFTIISTINSDVTLQFRKIRIKQGTELIPRAGYEPTPGYKGTVTDDVIAFGSLDVIPAKGQYVDETYIDINLKEALKNEDNAQCIAEVEYNAKKANGDEVIGKAYVPLNLTKSNKTNNAVKSTDFVLIPKVAIIRKIEGQTTVSGSGSNVILNGPVKVLFLTESLKNDSAVVTATNLSFTKDSLKQVNGGTFFGKAASGAEKNLFNFKFKSVLKIQVQQLSYNFNKVNKLLIKNAFSKIPVIDKKLFFKDLVINKNGLELKFSQQELTAFGLVFIVKNFSDVKSTTGNSKLSLGIGLRLNNKNSKEFISCELVVQNIKGGELTVELKGANGGGKALLRLIPTTDYLNFNSFKFVKKPKDNWVMQVGVSSSNLPIYSKISKDPINLFFEYEKSGKMNGKVEFVNEPKHGYDKNDKTKFEIGKLGAVDLTYLGFKIEQVQEITTVDSKPDTSWVFDFGKSQIGISADLYLASKGKQLNDLTNAIYLGEPGHPGITIDFEGNVKTQTISLNKDKKLDLGPVFLHMTKLAVTPYPFELGFTGGIGVAMENVFSGEVKIENLKINDKGKFTNLDNAVKGGDLSIVKVLELKIDKLQFSSTPATLTYSKSTGSSAAKTSLQVENYFLMEGASLKFGKSGAAGGSLKRLLLYETSNNQSGSNTNFILNEGKLSIKNAIDLTIDIEYVKGSQGEHLGVGGTVNLFSSGKSSGYGGTVYGEIGNRINGTDTTNYWGFYIQANLGKTGIPLGPVNLTGVGGGFFYHPTQANIQKVTSFAGFTPLKITGVDSYGKPKLSNTQKWALFLYAGLSIGGSDFISGKAFITVTNSYFKLNSEVKAISGKAHGKAFLNINWDQDFIEGKFQFGLNFVVIKAEEKNNYFQFYAYSNSKWGVMGKTDIRCFLIKTTSDIYVGNQGFLFDFALEESIDLYVISGGFRIEAMTWWRKNVNWGIYASGKAWGDVLGGLIGAEIGVEGALISNPFLIYVGGHLKVKVVWVTVFNGRAWITISEDGLDGGTGGNDKFDKLIADARNVGKQMKKSMDDLKNELQAARDALYDLSDAQRIAAGKTLMQLSAWSGESGIGNLYKEWFKYDLHGRIYPYDNIYTSDIPTHGLLNNFNVIWNSQASKLGKVKTKLEEDSIAIANALDDIQSMESELNSLLSSQSELFTGELPTLSDLSKLKSPVTKPTFTPSTITINGNAKQVMTFGYDLDSASTETLTKTVTTQKEELEEYQNKLVSMVGEYKTKLKEIESILYSENSSVASIANKYAATFDKISDYTTNFMDYMSEKNDWAITQNNKLVKPSTFDLDIQRTWTDQSTAGDFDKITKQRIDIINSLIKAGDAKSFAPPSNNISYENYKTMGMNLYYNIPKAGYKSVANELVNLRPIFAKKTKANMDLYFTKWNGFTMQSDKVYSREAKLYTILYDLFDQLSLEAGTRKIEKASTGDMLLDPGSGSGNQYYLIPIVGSDGIVSTGSGSSYSIIEGPTFESEGDNFEQVVQSGNIDPSAVNNINKTVNKAIWASNWDFEKERKTVKKILEIPKLTQFSGTAYSDKNTLGYSKLTLNWGAEHPISIAEYSFAIEDYTEPVNISDLSSGEPTVDETVNNTDEFNMWDNVGGLFLGDYFTQNSGDNNSQKVDATGTGNNVSSATVLDDQPSHIWFTAGQHNKIVLPFLMRINDEGTYNVAVRVRGAGGYTLTRTGTVNIEYCGGTNKTTGIDFDWSPRISSLETSDQTPPTTPSVDDGGDITSSLNTLFVKWSSTDYESGIQEYQYQVAYDNGNARGFLKDVTTWISAGGQTELNIRLNEQLIPGKKYYVLVKAKNGVGMWSSVGRSNGIELKDPTPPTKPSFSKTGRGNNKFDYVLILRDSLLSANWYSASDPESDIIGYLFAVGTTENSSDVINWCAVKSTSLSLDKTQLDKLLNIKLQKNATYYFSVKAMNGIGIVGDAVHQAVVVN